MSASRLHLLFLKEALPCPSLAFTCSLFSSLSFSSSCVSSRPLPRLSTARRLLCSKSDPAPQSDSTTAANAPSIVGDLLDYLNESWTQFHATAEAKRQLIDAGFLLLNENDDWDLQPGGRYFFTRNMSCLVAFAVGEKHAKFNYLKETVKAVEQPCDIHILVVLNDFTHLMRKILPFLVNVEGSSVYQNDTSREGKYTIKVTLYAYTSGTHMRVARFIILSQTLGYRTGSGFHVIAAHTDSPCLKLKPRSASSKSGFQMVNVQTYGGGLWHTWFDRDLSVAGRVILKDGNDSFIHKLVKVRRPLLRVPTLAIHLDRTVNTEGFKPNLETQLVPLFATKVEEAETRSEEKTTVSSPSKNSHHSLLLQVLSEELHSDVSDIVGMELNVCDTQSSCLGGGSNEFIFSGRLDNLASSFCALRSLIDSSHSPEDLADEGAIRMVALFDNEEVGSDSVQGAGAPTMFQAMRRIVDCLTREQMREASFERAIRSSFLVSADMAHGLHPNFPEKYEEHHRPHLQKGVVIKHNANQRYATSGLTAFLFKEVANSQNLPVQEFVVRNDMGCGSTIGPILASGVGIRTVDCGIPQLSMHSVREICGKEDVDIAYKLFIAFFKSFSSIDKKLNVDF